MATDGPAPDYGAAVNGTASVEPDGAAPDRFLTRLVRELAGRPVLVVIVTAAMALAATLLAVAASPSLGAVGAILALVSFWALFLSLVIYLLTAHDNDKVMDQIGALQEQLGAALAAPGPGAQVVEPPDPPAVPAPLTADPPPPPVEVESTPSLKQVEPSQEMVTGTPTLPGPSQAGPSQVKPAPAGRNDERAVRRAALAQARTALWREGTWGMPEGYLDAWRRLSGRAPNDIARTWTPDPSGQGPWVIEGEDGSRWSVMQSRNGKTMVLPIGRSKGHKQRTARDPQARADRRASPDREERRGSTRHPKPRG